MAARQLVHSDYMSLEKIMNRDEIRIFSQHALLLLCLAFWIVPAQAVQICNSDMLQTTPDSHYQDNGDGTVTASHTGLMWQKCSVGQSGANCSVGTPQNFIWDLALQYPCSGQQFHGLPHPLTAARSLPPRQNPNSSPRGTPIIQPCYKK